MSEWKEIELGEVADVQTGPFGSQLKNEQYITGGTPVVTVEHIQDFRIIDFDYPSITDEDKDRLSKYLMKEGDILFTRVGSVDLSAYVSKGQDGWMFSSRMLRVRPNQEINSRFLSYFFQQKSFRDYIINIAVGATMPSINTGILKTIPISYPPLEIQNAIASVLSSLDDKIDLLHRQNQTLEQMAEALFRQWFVEEADEGWEEKLLSEYFQLPGGFAFKSKDYLDVGKYKVITIKGVQDGYLDSSSAARLEILPEKIKPYQILNTGDILMSLTGNVGRVCLVDEENCLLNQRVAKIEPINRKWKAFAYFYFRQNEMIERLTYLSKGSAQLNLSPVETLAQTEHFPDDSLIDSYCELVNPFLFKIMTNQTQIRTLSALRDTLLPKLMSGEVRVEMDATAKMEEA